MVFGYQNKYIYNYKIRYISQQETWGCQKCDYKVDKYQRARKIGNIAPEHVHM